MDKVEKNLIMGLIKKVQADVGALKDRVRELEASENYNKIKGENVMDTMDTNKIKGENVMNAREFMDMEIMKMEANKIEVDVKDTIDENKIRDKVRKAGSEMRSLSEMQRELEMRRTLSPKNFNPEVDDAKIEKLDLMITLYKKIAYHCDSLEFSKIDGGIPNNKFNKFKMRRIEKIENAIYEYDNDMISRDGIYSMALSDW